MTYEIPYEANTLAFKTPKARGGKKPQKLRLQGEALASPKNISAARGGQTRLPSLLSPHLLQVCYHLVHHPPPPPPEEEEEEEGERRSHAQRAADGGEMGEEGGKHLTRHSVHSLATRLLRPIHY